MLSTSIGNMELRLNAALFGWNVYILLQDGLIGKLLLNLQRMNPKASCYRHTYHAPEGMFQSSL